MPRTIGIQNILSELPDPVPEGFSFNTPDGLVTVRAKTDTGYMIFQSERPVDTLPNSLQPHREMFVRVITPLELARMYQGRES